MHKNQHGVATILLLVLAAIVISAVGYVGYSAYKSKTSQSKTQTAPVVNSQNYSGRITLRECFKAGPGCGYRFQTDNNNYALSGSGLSSYVGKPVNIGGKITQINHEPAIEVASIQPVATGTLKGRVTCNEKVTEEPCATQITIKYSTGVTSNSLNINPAGIFSVELAPGKYTLVPEVKPNYPEFTPPIPNPITIIAGQTTTVNIPYQSGLK